MLLLQVLPASTDSRRLDEAVWLATLGEYESAIALFELSLREEPDDPICNYFVGVSHFFLGDQEEAIRFLERSVENTPGFPQPYYWLAQTYLKEGDWDEAVEVVRAGLEVFPKNEKLLKLASKLGMAETQQRGTTDDSEAP